MEAKGGEALRKSSRAKKVSQSMKRVGAEERKQAAQARLDALERDNIEEDAVFGMNSDDEEFVLEGSSDEEQPQKKKRKLRSGQRKTRKQRERPTTFAAMLEEADLENEPKAQPNYLTATAGPAISTAARKFCSVCGYKAPYTCTRCGTRFCSRKCMTVHAETRCLKFTL